MSQDAASGRWWENYLVRYFMPSIAGIAIVGWLLAVGPDDLRAILFFGKGPASLDAPTLTLLVLYGNLFCYVASYPILCFHATRVADFQRYAWRPRPSDGYIATAAFGFATIATCVAFSGVLRVIVSIFLAVVFITVQLYRIWESLQAPRIQGYTKRPAPLIYAYMVTLAKRRGVVSKRTTTATGTGRNSRADDESDPQETVEEESRWQREVIDSYRHMREHGNSGFIFSLEIVLAATCYGIVRIPGLSGAEVLALLGAFLAVWSAPAVLVHLLGQYLERRYSIFDRRLEAHDDSEF